MGQLPYTVIPQEEWLFYTPSPQAPKCNYHCIQFNPKVGYLYNFDPIKPHFYIIKLGFTGVYIIFLIYAQKRGGSNEYQQSMLWAENEKYQNFSLKTFSFF